MIGANIKFDENGFGDRQSEHPNLLGEVDEGQVERHSAPAPCEDQMIADALLGDIEMPSPMPATTSPVARMEPLHIKEPPEEASNTGEASSGPSELLELDPISPTSLLEMEFEDTIVLAPPLGSTWPQAGSTNIQLAKLAPKRAWP